MCTVCMNGTKIRCVLCVLHACLVLRSGVYYVFYMHAWCQDQVCIMHAACMPGAKIRHVLYVLCACLVLNQVCIMYTVCMPGAEIRCGLRVLHVCLVSRSGVYVSVLHACWVLSSGGSPETGVTNSCVSPCDSWKLNLGPV